MRNELIAIAVVTLLLGGKLSGGEGNNSEYYHHDRVALVADRSLISIKPGVAGLVFDTSDWSDSSGELPRWRFIGDLKIDSIVHYGLSNVALTQESQVESVFINSPELCEALNKIGARLLVKTFPNRVPADTLYEDEIRGKTHMLADMSVFYEVRYDSLISYDSVSRVLSKVAGLEYGRVSVPVVDSAGVKGISPR